MKKLKLGLIGYGNIGSTHIKSYLAGKMPNCEIIAVCDTSPARLEAAKNDCGERFAYYDNIEDFYTKSSIEAVVICVPHYDHPKLAIRAFERGLHVLVEKPAGVYTSAVRKMNEAAEKSGKVFGIMYNQRANPVYRKVREMVQSGELGEIKRVVWLITTWYRSQSYYNSGGWRATWAGEGGGVLLNQCPHQLDLWQWICGMPTRVRAFMSFGGHRNIEVEDDVTAYAEYPNGATGLFVTSVHETPGTNRLEITADHGKLVVENNEITFWRTRVTEKEFNETYTGGFGEPEHWRCEIPAEGVDTSHPGIFVNFADAVLKGTPLIAPGIEGIRGLSITNAMHLSAWTDSWAEPEHLDEALFEKLLQERIEKSTFVKHVSNKTLNTDGTY